MADGLMPHHTAVLPLHGLSQQEALALAFKAMQGLGWTVSQINDSKLAAHTNKDEPGLNSRVTIQIADGMAHINSTSTGTALAYSDVDRENVEAFVAAFNGLKASLPPDEIITNYEALLPKLAAPAHASTPERTQSWPGFLALFKPTKGYFITPILLDLNLIVFIMMAITGVNILEPDGQSMIRWGANFKPLTLDGQPWRLITNCFLHFGILHLLMNMYALLFIGLLLEPHLGKLRFAIAYLLTGIAASMTSLWWHDLSISAGASGAIFGMYGVFLALLTTNLVERRYRKVQLVSIGIFVGYNLVYGLQGNIDNAAHIGGLISGLAIGYAFIPGLKASGAGWLKPATVALVTLLVLGASFAAYKSLPNDIGIYDAAMKEFAATERQALAVFNRPAGTPEDSIILDIKQKGIPAWNKNVSLLTELESLKLPDRIRQRNKKLKQYCALRAGSYALIARQMEEHTAIYQADIDRYNTSINALIQELRSGQNRK